MLVSVAQQTMPVLRRSRSAQESMSSERDQSRAVELLKDDDSFASSLLVALRVLFGNQCLAWEPESIWVALDSEHGVDLSNTNRTKVLAASTLIQTPRFYADANVFEKTCLSFNDVVPLVSAINEASPAQLAWGVFESELLMGAEGEEPDFDYEPIKYTAVSLARDGFLVAPDLLSFAQEELSKLTRSPVEETIRAVHEIWERINPDALLTYDYEDTPVDVQLAKLSSVALYVRDRAARYERELLSILR